MRTMNILNRPPRKRIVKTEKWWIHFADGTKSLDIESAQSAYTLGFSNPEILDRMDEVMRETCRVMPFWSETHDLIDKYERRIKGKDWGLLKWTTSGSSAVECAVAMMDNYWKGLGVDKPGIISFTPVWHGTTYLTRSMNNRAHSPLNTSRVFNVPTPDWLDEEDRERQENIALEDVRDQFERNKIGGIIFNPIGYFNGITPFSTAFWLRLRNMCDEYEALMICDDITACWGKGKEWQSWQEYGLVAKPDIVAMGKAMTGGHAPFGVALCSPKIAQVVEGMTYGHSWNPYMGAIAAMDATTTIIERDGLIDRVRDTIEPANRLIARSFGDRIKGFRTHGAFMAIDLHKPLDQRTYSNVGLSTKHRPSTLKITVPFIADDEYYTELTARISQLL